MSETARFVVQTALERYELRECPVPEPAADHAVLAVDACGICGTDAEVFFGQQETPLPLVPGHEIVGRIAALGAQARRRWGLDEGDRIALSSKLACGRCHRCSRGQGCVEFTAGRLPNYGFQAPDGPYPLAGGFATHVLVAPQSEFTPVPAGASTAAASFFNALMGGLQWVVEAGELRPGQDVVVIGPGPRGLAAVIAALVGGGGSVGVVGLARDGDRLDVATRLGATFTVTADTEDPVEQIRDLTAGRGADLVVDCTPAASGVDMAVRAVAKRGRVVLGGLKGPAPVSVPVDPIVFANVTVRGVSGRSIGLMDDAMEIIGSGRFPLEIVATHTYGLEDAAVAVGSIVDATAAQRPIHARIEP